MFDEETKTVIELTRDVCDVARMAREVKTSGAIRVGLRKSENFAKSVKKVTNTLDDVENTEIQKAFKKFLVKLEHLVKDEPSKNLTAKTSLRISLDQIRNCMKALKL